MLEEELAVTGDARGRHTAHQCTLEQVVDLPVHRLAAARNVSGLENLDGLDRLPARGAVVIALPIKIEGGSGGPVRVIALLPK